MLAILDVVCTECFIDLANVCVVCTECFIDRANLDMVCTRCFKDLAAQTNVTYITDVDVGRILIFEHWQS